MHDLCIMATKTISLEIDAYKSLAKEKRERESFSQVVRRMVKEHNTFKDCVPALTAGELLEALKPFEGIGAGSKLVSRKRRHAAA